MTPFVHIGVHTQESFRGRVRFRGFEKYMKPEYIEPLVTGVSDGGVAETSEANIF